jgi:hypothetical protein
VTVNDAHYRALAAHERVRLLVAAGARGDEPEQQRLLATAQHVKVTMADPAVRHLYDDAQRVVVALVLELGPPLAHLDVVGALTHGPGDQHSLVERLAESVREAYLSAWIRGHFAGGDLVTDEAGNGLSGEDDGPQWDAAQIAASAASDDSVGPFVNALDTIEQAAAHRAATALAAFETWATSARFDPGGLLSQFAPLTRAAIALHSARIEAAVVDESSTTELGSILAEHVPPGQYRESPPPKNANAKL